MVTFNDLLSWSGTDLFEAGDALVAASHKYEQVNAGLKQDGLGDGLSGKTFEAEAKARRILADDAEDLWTGLEKAGNDLKDASATVNTIKNSASSTQSSISAAGLKIKDDNTVAVKDQQSGASASTSIASYQNEVDRLVEQAGDTVTFISSVYAEIAKLDDTANGPSPEVVNHGERPPNPNWTPSQVNDWWTSLTDAQRQNIINKHPAWIGNRAGIPSTVRDKANRKWLEIMVKDIDREVENFDPSKKTKKFTQKGEGEYRVNTEEYNQLLARQKELHALSDMLKNDAGSHSLLVLDNTGKHLRAAVGTGDIDGADNVIVNTPGMDTGVTEEIADTYDEDKKQARKPSEIKPGSAVNNTDSIVNEAAKTGESVAGVTWLGYDAPTQAETAEGTNSVVSDKAAKDAAKDLASFYDGIQETHHGDPHLVAAGHSYGSLATGYALRQSTAPDDFSIMGSPGPSSVDASDFHTLPDHTFAAANNWDPVAASGYYGGNPTTNPNSDFTALDTDANGPYKYTSGHSNYTDKDSTSLHNQGQILKGEKPDYVDRPSIKQG
ncbi:MULTISPECIES: alpha/beta hydrolase [Actinomyces]|uniref:DUF1023 domain-containing protein n=1 Tax=Actinomyces viscosus C505 TaxID=562973 RepID=F2UXS1_ACTVI|nr:MULTISPECIES: alpha/beta hydrolase [Actinomyces]EGE38022.1 hypothetical protein HMPREF0059_00873 [Actinomyces viscosus C505]